MYTSLCILNIPQYPPLSISGYTVLIDCFSDVHHIPLPSSPHFPLPSLCPYSVIMAYGVWVEQLDGCFCTSEFKVGSEVLPFTSLVWCVFV